ncbi:MAG: replicative DNA helicase [Planctomycetota bacterium]|jgi:replicative DNA helicase
MTTDYHEAKVLGAALAEPGLWLAEIPRIRAELFARNRALAVELLELTRSGKPTDPTTVKAHLDDKGIEAKLCDLLKIADHAPVTKASLGHALDALHDHAKRASLRELASRLLRQTENRSVRTDDILVAGLLGLSDIGAQSTRQIQPISKVLREVMANISKPVTASVRTGISDLDHVTSGLKPGELVLLGARPSMGKTSLALGIARQAALAGRTVAIFSLEMSPAQVVERFLADLSGVDLARIVTHRCGSNDIAKVTSAASRVHQFKIFVAQHSDQMDPICRQLKHQEGLDLVIVDYLQLMDARAESREQGVSKLSRGLKVMAGQLRVPVLCLSQLNRAVEARSCKRPQLSDLRESGSLEQDADIVMLLWRPGYYDTEADQTEAELIVAKNRNGPTGLVDLRWRKECARFEPAEN